MRMAEKQFSSVYLDNTLFGIDILMIREINRNLELTSVDQAPEYVRGLLNLRGQIVTVLDLGIRLGKSAREIDAGSRCVVLKTVSELPNVDHLNDTTTEDMVGILIDRVGDMVTVDDGKIEPPPANVNGVDGQYINGIIKLKDDIMVILNISAVLKL